MHLWRRRERPLSELSSEEIIAVKTFLEGSVDRFESAMHWFTALVAVGLIVEYREPFLKFIETHDWRYIRDAVGGIMVTVGVAGELLIGFAASLKDGRLRDANSVLQSRLTELLTASNERIAELNLKAEQERNARVKLQSEMAGRYISSKQALFLKEKLEPWRGIALVIVQGTETAEAWRFASLLDEVMGAKGCQWDSFINRDKPAPPMLPVDGLHIFPTLTQWSQQAAMALALALNEIGVTCLAPPDATKFSGIDRGPHFLQRFWPPGAWHPEKDAVLLIVGDKPLPERPDL
jgi:hypothetical protein